MCVCVCVSPFSLSFYPKFDILVNCLFKFNGIINIWDFCCFPSCGKELYNKKLSRVLLNTSKNNFFHLKIWAFKKNQVLVARLKNHHYGHVILLTQVFGRQVWQGCVAKSNTRKGAFALYFTYYLSLLAELKNSLILSAIGALKQV